MIITLIRHGETDYNKTLRFQGLMDNELNTTGIAQAKKVGEYLKKTGKTFDMICSSPLVRAYKTSNIIKDILELDVEIKTYDGLMERDFRQLDGKKISKETLDLVFNDQGNLHEKNEEFEGRVHKAFRKAVNENMCENLLITAHAHTIKAVLRMINPLISYAERLENTCVNRVSFNNNVFEIIEYNNSEHLK